MKKILYLVLVALLAAAVPTWGQTNRTLGDIPTGWKVQAGSVNFTADENNHEVQIPAGSTVTLTPMYPAKVKSVKLKDVPPTGAIKGEFTVNAGGKKVWFSQGNLQAVCSSADNDASTQETWTWQFATNQWDYIGSAAANTSINGSGSVSVAGTVDLFGWVGTSSYNNNYGIWNNTTANSYGNTKNESLKNDWGHNAIANGGNSADMWRTLTREEWGYMLSTRSGATVNGTNEVRFAKATIRTDETAVKGVILFPDGATFEDSEASWNDLNSGYNNYTTTCTAAQWTALEAKGCVFLPAAGNRTGTTVSDAGNAGAYWTATGSDSKASDTYPNSYGLYFASTSWGNPQYYSQQQKSYGLSVRLVKVVPHAVDLSTLTGDYEAQDGDILINTLAGNYKITIADRATVTLRNATINGTNNNSYQWAGITCLGDATIVLEGTNTVKGFYHKYPGIQAAHRTGSGDEYTLTIKGTGSLNASSNGYAPGIGGGYVLACGNIAIESGTITSTGSGGGAGIGGGSSASCGNITISGGTIEATGSGSSAGIGSGSGHNPGDTYGEITISGGTVTATGGQYGAGIGSGSSSNWGNINITGGTVTATGGELAAGIGSGSGYSLIYGCGNISITGGTVTATGGSLAAGIGSGKGANCGTVTITDGVTSVTATKASDATNSIGAGNNGSCGTVSIGGATGAITTSPYTYPTPPYNATITPLTFEAKADGFTVTLYSDLVPLPSLEYSIDGGAWTTYTCNDATPAINEGHTISFRGNNTRYFIYDEWEHSSVFSCSRDCYLYGNIMSLVSASSYATASSVEETAFCWLFESNTNIYSHNTKELVLPATTLARYCYKGLFNGCTHLTTAPNLPAETLAEYCYESMFAGCEGLVKAPEISATTLAAHCCENMFIGCTSLTTGPTLSATTLAEHCYYYMFQNCSNLNSVTCLATTYLSAVDCTSHWLQGVAATGTFTAANTSVGWSTGVSGIPSGWTRVNAQ